MGGIRQGGTRSVGDIGGLLGRGTAIVHPVATGMSHKALIISSGNLFLYGTTRTLKACWRRTLVYLIKPQFIGTLRESTLK